MDANQTRYHLLMDTADWAACRDADLDAPLAQAWAARPVNPSALDWSLEGRELTLKPLLFKYTPAPKDRLPRPEDRRGAACDRFGSWYWIGPNRTEVLVCSAGSGAAATFWPVRQPAAASPADGSFQPQLIAPPAPAPIFSGLAVTADHYLLVGQVQPAGLLVFDLHAVGAPQTLLWPDGIAFAPFDMSPRPGGGVWILDRVNQRLWGLDRRFNPEAPQPAPARLETFQPLAGGPPRASAPFIFPSGTVLTLSSPVSASDPVAVETLPDDSVLILDRRPAGCASAVARYRCGLLVGAPLSLDMAASLVETGDGKPYCLVGHDLAFTPENAGSADTGAGPQLDRVYVAAADGNQVFAFNIWLEPAGPAGEPQLALQPLHEYFPMRLSGGAGVVAAGTRADGFQPYYDFSNGAAAPPRWVRLVRQARPRFVERALLETPVQSASLGGSGEDRPAFDSRIPGCAWHRLTLDGCIPPETSVVVWSRAADSQADLVQAAWQAEPRPYQRRDGSEIPFARSGSRPGEGTWELLLQQARGRYLQLRLQLGGDGRSTPRVRALRVYYPRFSYLEQYLPPTYREDRSSADFLERFLANFEGFFTAIEDRMAAAQMLLDLRTVPPEALEWLAGFYGIVFDPSWNPAQRYFLLKYAMQIFQYRGTAAGLQLLLFVALHPAVDEALAEKVFSSAAQGAGLELCGVRIVERYRTRQQPSVLFGDPTSVGTTIGADPGDLSDFRPPAHWQPAAGGIGYHLPGDFSGYDPGAVQAAWGKFLLRRYRRVGALNQAHGSDWAGFEVVPLPDYLPRTGRLTRDWYVFETMVLAMYRTAHRFTIMLPAAPGLPVDSPEHQRRLDLVRRVAAMEKPAHTTFDIRFYWAMFRVGEARLGQDTLIHLGSRDPQLLPGMLLGRGSLSEAVLAPGHPQNVQTRFILGRDS